MIPTTGGKVLPNMYLGQEEAEKLRRHPASAAWGTDDGAIDRIMDSYRRNGYDLDSGMPIVLMDRKVIDGWHRVQAYCRLGTQLFLLPLVEADHPCSPIREAIAKAGVSHSEDRRARVKAIIAEWLIQHNAARRHVTGVDLARAAAKVRIALGQKPARGGRPKKETAEPPTLLGDETKTHQSDEFFTAREVADEVGVSPATAQRGIKDAKIEAGLEPPPAPPPEPPAETSSDALIGAADQEWKRLRETPLAEIFDPKDPREYHRLPKYAAQRRLIAARVTKEEDPLFYLICAWNVVEIWRDRALKAERANV